MATSGTASAVFVSGAAIQIEWSLTNQDHNAHKSNIYISIYISADNSTSISGAPLFNGSIECDGKRIIGFSNYLDVNVSAGERKKLYSVSASIEHLSDGSSAGSEIEFDIWRSGAVVNGESVSWKSVTATVDLPAITDTPSLLEIPSLTLGEPAVLTILPYLDGVTHTIKYYRLYYSGIVPQYELLGTVCENVSETSIEFVPPLSLSSLNTTGTTVEITFGITTHFSDKDRERYQTVYADIPESVVPSCALSISDVMGYTDKYGGYVQGESKFHIEAIPVLAYGAEIASYRIEADNQSFTGSVVDSIAIRSAGEVTIKATVTDTRGRSSTVEEVVSVLAYTRPTITLLKVKRCNEDGTETDGGEYAQATFSAAITPLDSINSAAYTFGYRKTTDEEFTEISLSEYADTYTINEIVQTFAAETGSSYDVFVTAADDFHTTTRDTTVSTAYTIFHVPASGRGFSFGKVSDVDGLFDVAFLARFLGGYMLPVVDDGESFDNVTTPNQYACNDASAAGYLNSPFASGAFVLEVSAAGGDIIQRATALSASGYDEKVRFRIGGVWGDWRSTASGSGTSSATPSGKTFEQAMRGCLI